jgi:hypothetical protein
MEGVTGSNPVAPTIYGSDQRKRWSVCCLEPSDSVVSRLDLLALAAQRKRPLNLLTVSVHTVVMRPSPPVGYWAAVTTPPRGPVPLGSNTGDDEQVQAWWVRTKCSAE